MQKGTQNKWDKQKTNIKTIHFNVTIVAAIIKASSLQLEDNYFKICH